ncbi:MAG: LuxR family transcriptional regulator, partial [Actinomycetes bacterium]
MWEERAERARRDIAAMAAAGVDLADLYISALAVVQKTVPFDQGCWTGVDPASMAMTSITNWRPWPVSGHQFDEYFLRFAQSEYLGREPNTFVELLARPRPVARISDAPHRDVVRSIRVNELLKPLGLEHELRAAFR